jgi:hypothetical protein
MKSLVFIPCLLRSLISFHILSLIPFEVGLVDHLIDQLTLLLHKDPVEIPGCPYKEPIYSLLPTLLRRASPGMIPFKSHPVEYKESHIRLSTKRLRPQKIGDCFVYYSTGATLELAKVL